MAAGRKYKLGKYSKTIVVIAECLNGAFETGEFAARHLLDHSSRIILLLTRERKAPAEHLMIKRMAH